MDDIIFVGLDVHKATVCVAVAESGRGGEVRQIGRVLDRKPLREDWWDDHPRHTLGPHDGLLDQVRAAKARRQAE